mmetsp:Transcript_57983/g.138048  ORF Transcript_57983/g.138048 Transcript_57983/m.138048 type:complete len:215 (+) Transcript_57983:68-712(+)
MNCPQGTLVALKASVSQKPLKVPKPPPLQLETAHQAGRVLVEAMQAASKMVDHCRLHEEVAASGGKSVVVMTTTSAVTSTDSNVNVSLIELKPEFKASKISVEAVAELSISATEAALGADAPVKSSSYWTSMPAVVLAAVSTRPARKLERRLAGSCSCTLRMSTSSASTFSSGAAMEDASTPLISPFSPSALNFATNSDAASASRLNVKLPATF